MTDALISTLDFESNRSSQVSTVYNSLSVDGWNVVVFSPTFTGFYSWINNMPLYVHGGFFRGGVDLTVGSVDGDAAKSVLGGSLTELYTGSSEPATTISKYFYIVD